LGLIELHESKKRGAYRAVGSPTAPLGDFLCVGLHGLGLNLSLPLGLLLGGKLLLHLEGDGMGVYLVGSAPLP
jgi:hypothetical protein